MRKAARSLYCLLALLVVPLVADAGPNAGGTLIVHGIPEYIPTPPDDGCGLEPLAACDEANVEFDDTLYHIWKAYAAFPAPGSPRLKGITFGIEYPQSTMTLWEVGPCAEFELPDPDWPDSGTGNSLVWDETRTDFLVEVYWFGGYQYYQEAALFQLTANPDQGGYFADDSLPSILDPIAAFGALGFFTPGLLVCPESTLGACCEEDGTCTLVIEEVCLEACGMFMGPGVPCDPNPCPGLPYGACCLPDGSCEMHNEYVCECVGGTYMGDAEPCEPNPCEPIPTRDGSWGRIKNRYR